MNKKSGGVVLALAGLVMMAAFPLAAAAKEKSSQTFEPNASLGQWRVSVQERMVKTITVEIKRVRGDNNTFINARFGRESQTFEGGRRVYLRHGDWETVTWNVNEAPNGKELIFNAYDGEVLLRKVRVKY
jgi:predicted phosphodiesterase